MPTTTSPLTPATHGLRVAASFNPFYDGRLLTPMRHDLDRGGWSRGGRHEKKHFTIHVSISALVLGKIASGKDSSREAGSALAFFISHSSVILRLLFVEKILPLQRA
jgi:hypothetical protein